MKKVRVGVIGAGAVGVKMLQVLKERNFPCKSLRIFGRSNRTMMIDGQSYQVETVNEDSFKDLDIALFAGTEGEKGAAVMYAQKAIQAGCVVIDNGADFRLKDDVPLVVPEVNAKVIKQHKGLVANPNCTTIQMVTALGGIHKQYKISSIILVSFQSVSGAGREALSQLWEETSKVIEANKSKQTSDFYQYDLALKEQSKCFSRQIAFNVIPQIGSFSDSGYTSEEDKTVHETRKIFNNPKIKVTSTCVRVPVFFAHSEAVYFSVKKKTVTKQDIENVLAQTPGVKFIADNAAFPTPIEFYNRDEVFVGRVRQDPQTPHSFWLWCVSDNLRKGAATNAVQIAEHIKIKKS